MATTFVGFNSAEWRDFVNRQNARGGRRPNEEDPDPFDTITDHDDDETDDYALYRLGIK